MFLLLKLGSKSLFWSMCYKGYKEEDTRDQKQNEVEDDKDLPIAITALAAITVSTLPAMYYNDNAPVQLWVK